LTIAPCSARTSADAIVAAAALAPWLHVTPDFQYVFWPNGSDDEPDAAVLGVEIGIDFI
jgi:carbohydrate-selective porin OprB